MSDSTSEMDDGDNAITSLARLIASIQSSFPAITADSESFSIHDLHPQFLQRILHLRVLEWSLQSLASDLSSRLVVPNASNVAKMFLSSASEAESAMLEKNLERWRSVLHPEGQGQFCQSFRSEVNDFLVKHYRRMVQKTHDSYAPAHPSSALAEEDPIQSLLSILKAPTMQTLVTSVNELFITVFEQARNNCSAIDFLLPDSNTMYVSDLSAVSEGNLNLLLQLFSMPSQFQTKEEVLQALMQYIPMRPKSCNPNQLTCSMQCTKCLSPTLVSKECSGCGRPFCAQCPLRKGKLLSHGSSKLVPLCSECHNEMHMCEAKGWKEKCMQLLESEKNEDIQAAVACLLMGIYATKCSSSTAISHVNKTARQLIKEGLPELAMPLLSATTSLSETPAEIIRAHILTSKALESMAYNAYTLPREQLFLLKAAKAECDAVSRVKSLGTEVPDLSTRISTLERTVNIIESEDKRQLKGAIQIASSKLVNAWTARNWDDIFQLLSDTSNEHLKRPDKANPTIQAVKKFVETNNGDHNELILKFLEGYVCIFEGNICEGLANIEMSVWSSGKEISSKFYSIAIDLVIGVLVQHPENVMPLQNLHSSLEKISVGSSIDPSIVLPSLHLKEEDLLPPFGVQWPHLSQFCTGVIKSFEDFAVRKVTKGEWTGTKAAENYLDLIEKCHSQDEIAVCFLNAALWLLKALKEKCTETPLASELYSLKMAVFHYITQAFIVAVSCLQTGMQFYVARVALAATLLASKYAGEQATPSDARRVAQFLYGFLHAARFCPFWKAPLISASEANILTKMLDKQHSTFVSKLKFLPKEFCHLQQYEVHYKLYENHLTGLQKQDTPDNVKHQAMQELLQKNGLNWDNISSLMKTSLCKRSPEGWICNQQPIGTNLEFSEIKGLRVHFSSCSPLILELLVIRSNGKNGLVSSSDMDTFLTVEPNELLPLYFSLDPPSRDEKYHPFQELRFHPRALQNTEVLETLLDADYLMKFFSVGSEVSANPPFNQRPSVDGLLSKLPPKLKEALKSIPDYGSAKSSMYRFWIEANEMKYDIEHYGHVITVKCANPELIIRKHRLYHDPDGKLHDTKDDDDPDSPESKFAAAMTENYDEIGNYFPAFARLKELCKLQLLTTYIKDNVTKFSTNAQLVVNDIETNAKINISARTASKPAPPCWWVPASVSEKVNMLCYGGVNLAPKFVKSSLPALPHNTEAIRLQRTSLMVPPLIQSRNVLSDTSSTQRCSKHSGAQHMQRSSSSARKQNDPRPARIGQRQKVPHRLSAPAPVLQPPVVVFSTASCQQLPIANAFLSSPVVNISCKQPAFSELPGAVRKELRSLSSGSTMHKHQGTGTDIPLVGNTGINVGAGDGGGGSGGGGDSGGNNGGAGDGGNGGGDGCPSLILGGVVSVIIMTKLLSSNLRHAYAQRKFRKIHSCSDPEKHAAHTVSLQVVIYAIEDGILKGLIKIPREKIAKCLRKALNVYENFQLVDREVNLIDHQRHDRALINKDMAFLGRAESKERNAQIRDFVVKHLVKNLPWELANVLLEFFKERGIISSITVKKIEQHAEGQSTSPT